MIRLPDLGNKRDNRQFRLIQPNCTCSRNHETYKVSCHLWVKSKTFVRLKFLSNLKFYLNIITKVGYRQTNTTVRIRDFSQNCWI